MTTDLTPAGKPRLMHTTNKFWSAVNELGLAYPRALCGLALRPGYGAPTRTTPACPDCQRILAEKRAAGTPSSAATEANSGPAVARRHSGEVTTMTGLRATLREELTEAADHLQSAKAEQRLAVDDAARVEQTVTCLRQINAGPADLAEVAALRDAAIVRRDAAARAASAAEQRHAAASKALAGFQRRHAALAEAHATAPHAAQRRFYRT